MKSMRTHSNDNRSKSFKSRHSIARRDTKTSFNEKPTPLDFDSFIPWFCLELQVSKNVIVTRTSQVEYIRYDSKSSNSSPSKLFKRKSRCTKTKLSSTQSDIQQKRASGSTKISFATSTVDIKDAIPVTTCYDKRGRLIEIAIIGCPFAIPQKVIRAFKLCLPFHSGLSKLSIRKGGLSRIILYEISNLLPHSNITEICLDDSRVPEGNFSVLLDQQSHIKYLSLKRCGINSDECKNIATKLDINGPATKTLLLLDLTSNNIMDEGAQALGEMLKNNRHLMYLNISGNKISDCGISFILRYLQEFPLTRGDIIEKRRRRIDYLISKKVIYEKTLEEVKLARMERSTKADLTHADQTYLTTNSPHQSRRKKTNKIIIPSYIIKQSTAEDEAEKKTMEIIGQFTDPFEEQNIIRKGDLVCAAGNLVLTYLNVAYNNLSLLSLKQVLKVLEYQSGICALTKNTGLLRIVIDGNNIPTHCDELYEIDVYLYKALSRNTRKRTLTMPSSHKT